MSENTLPTVENAVVSPKHYKSHPSGIECIQVIRHFTHCIAAAIKYLWRADTKHDDGGKEDLRKAMTYVADELVKREGINLSRPPVVLMALPIKEAPPTDNGFIVDTNDGETYLVDYTPLLTA